jgi:cysteine synthase A
MRVEPSFVAGVIDDMVRVPDAASIATMRWVSRVLNRPVGGSTGTNMWASLGVIEKMRQTGRTGSVVTLLCDGGERYLHTYYDDGWLAEHDIDITPYADALDELEKTGVLPEVG